MSIIDKNTGLYTDHYELTMAQGYFLEGKQDQSAGFDYFFRKNPFGGGYVVFAGLQTLLEMIEGFCFDTEDCRYLESRGFDRSFTEYLKAFRFRGSICSVREGEMVFPGEPVIRVEGNLVETQLIESLLLNQINFQSLIATKASRMRLVAGDRGLVDFGLRRAQGYGAIHAARAAIIGGFDSSSNVFGAYRYSFDSSGTMAHSWVQSFPSELEAFRAFVRHFPDNAILLADTYDTLKKGVPNAITVAHELEKKGKRLTGIRLDSGDLSYLSKEARRMLDQAGLSYVRIIASNQLDEYLIRSLTGQEAPLDGFGVGTALVIGKEDGALDGVYKLSTINGNPTLKVSENPSKITLPGRKSIYRFVDRTTGRFVGDGIELSGKEIPGQWIHSDGKSRISMPQETRAEEIVQPVMEQGKTLHQHLSLKEIAAYSRSRLQQIKEETLRFENPQTYIMCIGEELFRLQEKLRKEA